MKRTFLVMAVLLLSASATWAVTTQKFTPGWDNFGEPLNYKKSNVKWSVNPTKSTLSITYTLVDAMPTKQYQVSLNIFCTTFPATFGQFPANGVSGGGCTQWTAQAVTKTEVWVEVGAVTTDINGNGSFTVVVGPIASGTYELAFGARNGVGYEMSSGCGCSSEIDFQSPGPIFGDATTITIP